VRSLGRRSYAGISRPYFSAVFLLLFILFISPLQSVFNSGDAQAAIIPWSPSSGPAADFNWQNGGSDKGLFGSPTLDVDGHTLRFSLGDNFIARSFNGASAIKSDRLQVDILAHSNIEIIGVEITESGVYDINTQGKVLASAAVFLTNLSQYDVHSAMFQMNPAMPISTPPINDANWSGHVVVEELGWTQLRIVLNNNLIATSRSGSNSFIQKTEFDIKIITKDNDIPEPATIAVLTLGGSILSLFGRKTKNS
jgi:hypothetical protein